MFTPILPAPAKHASGQHQYGTRTRSNSVIKPSVRLRQTPDAPQSARRTKPSTTRKNKLGSVVEPATAPFDFPPFPPEHVLLHPDDASNKVFIALGRALMTVDNRAITVKDLAELAMKHGLACQNVSAAGQAITTFIRTHYARCEEQNDQPLLLKHHMSGTVFDDDLVPALYSRVGGAHCTINTETQSRLTNFRRGTQVWYLSKAAGGPCPFARAGIRICDYNEDGKVGSVPNPGRERKRERDRLRKAAQTCGQKRKRLHRSCADKGPPSSDSSDAEEERPPKVKLTLRLRPCFADTQNVSTTSPAPSTTRSESPRPEQDDTDVELESVYESDSDAMSVQGDEDDSAESASDVRPSHSPALPSTFKSNPTSTTMILPVDPYGRSMSPPCSDVSGSPPPDSEAEDDDYHITMTDTRRLYAHSSVSTDDEDSAWDDDFFNDVDVDAETQWDSPGPRSPSAQPADQVVVKQEPMDVRGLLDAWEDLESRATDRKVIDIVAQAAAAERQRAEEDFSDDLAHWQWPSPLTEETEHIKEEDVEPQLFFTDTDFQAPSETVSHMVPYDPYDSPVEERASKFESGTSYEPHWRDVELLGPDSIKPGDLEDGAWHEYRARPCTPEDQVRSLSPEPCIAAAASSPTSPTLPRTTLFPLDLKSTNAGPSITQARNPSITSPSLLASLTSLSIQARIPSSSSFPAGNTVPLVGSTSCVQSPSREDACTLVVHTIDHLDPPISATQFESVPVYQMPLGSSTLLRRIDTDFVNISPIMQHFGSVHPSVTNATVITGGSPEVCGTWVPLDAARDAAKSEPTLTIFLSEELRSRFPASLDVLHPASDQEPPCTGFGHQFKSASDARRRSMASHRLELPPREFEVSWEDHLLTHPPFILASASAIDGHHPIAEETPPVVEALSPTEEAMFHVLCADPEWDALHSPTEEEHRGGQDAGEEATVSVCAADADATQERPLRRSKRVATTVVTRSRTRSSKRGSRTSVLKDPPTIHVHAPPRRMRSFKF